MQSQATPHELFAAWKDEDRELESQLDFIREWMLAVGETGVPRFQEAAKQLRELRTYLVCHFEREDEISNRLSVFYNQPSREIEAMRRQADRDHRQLLDRIDQLIRDFSDSQPPFDSWRTAIEQVDWFVCALEQHEEQESESICALMPIAERGRCTS